MRLKIKACRRQSVTVPTGPAHDVLVQVRLLLSPAASHDGCDQTYASVRVDEVGALRKAWGKVFDEYVSELKATSRYPSPLSSPMPLNLL